MNSRNINQRQSSDYKMKQLSSLPSCFLTPESAEKPTDFGRVTPTLDQSSSVFLSPPSSLERKTVPNFAITTPNDPLKVTLDFEDYGSGAKQEDPSPVRSPLLPVDRIIGRMAGRNQVDFITELLGYNCEQICKTICGYLSDLDLCRFASVSEKWRTFIKHDLQSHDRLRTYLSQRKQYCDLKGKENRGSPTSLKDGSKFPRMPLLDLHVNINSLGQVRTRKTSNQSSSTSQPSSESTQRTPHTGTYRPCPKCTSRSVVEVLDGYCHCQKCELKYCVVCLRDISYHNGKTCKGLREPQDRREKRTRSRKKGMDQVVGSKQTKERIRRL